MLGILFNITSVVSERHQDLILSQMSVHLPLSEQNTQIKPLSF